MQVKLTREVGTGKPDAELSLRAEPMESRLRRRDVGRPFVDAITKCSVCDVVKHHKLDPFR